MSKEFLALFRGGEKEITAQLMLIKKSDDGEYYYKRFGRLERFKPLHSKLINFDNLHYESYTFTNFNNPIELRVYDINMDGEGYSSLVNNTLYTAKELAEMKLRLAKIAYSSVQKRLIDLKGEDRKQKAEIKTAEHMGRMRQKIYGYTTGESILPLRPLI